MKIEKEREYQNRRLRLITPLLHNNKEQNRSLLLQIAQANNISVRTLKRYLKRYRQEGISGLIPRYVGSGTFVRLFTGFEQALKRAVALRKQDPYISVRNIIAVLESEHPEWKNLICRSTLQRYLQKQQVTLSDLRREEKCRGRKVYGRYRKQEILEQIQCDVKELPKVCVNESGVTCKGYLQLWSDNCSRKILAFKLSDTQDVTIALDPLKTLIERYGVFDSILTDNGSIYRSAQMEHACNVLGIKLNFCKPYSPEAKGMIERQNLALNEIEHQIENLNSVRLSALTELITLWINRYNAQKSSSLNGLSPDEVFSGSARQFKFLDPDIIALAFTQSCSRKISKDGTVSFNHTLYKADLSGADEHHRVTLLVSYDNKVEQVLPDNRTVRIFPIEIKSNVDFKADRAVAKETSQTTTSESNNGSDADPALLIALLRDEARKNGTYKDEASFLAEVKQRLFYTVPATPALKKQSSMSTAPETYGTASTPSVATSPFSKLTKHHN